MDPSAAPTDETTRPPSGPVDVAEVEALLRGVIDPELGSDIVDLGMVRAVAADDEGHVTVTIALTTAGCPLRAQIQRDVRSRAASARASPASPSSGPR